MSGKRAGLMLLLLLTAGVSLASAQVDAEETDTVAMRPEPGAVTVFLDCGECDDSFIQRQIRFVNFVRDPLASSLHVLVTQQWTGGGGRVYRLAFLGRAGLVGRDLTLTYTAPQGATYEERRRGLTRTLQMGLLPYVSGTSAATRIDISYSGAGGSAPLEAPRDRWNSWVFRISGSGSLDREASQGEYELNGHTSADRVTEEWKFRTGMDFAYDRERFENDDVWLNSTTHNLRLHASAVKSLTSRWSAALFADGYSETYQNVARAVRLSPGIEYNVFPWDLSDRKEFTIAYTTGLRSFRYQEETIYDRTEQTLAFQSLRSRLRLTQPWGSVQSQLEASHYLQDPSLYRLQLNTYLNFRLTRGLALEFNVGAESIHDQLSLRKGDATLEEILLRRRQLATTYELRTGLGLRYTFGSVFNDVVNERF